jgi:flagella basal body P-ring formation protein FlgA
MRPLFLLAALAALPASSQAATPRGLTTLDRPTVRIADLFDDAGEVADRVLGPGPAPGGRIVVDTPQLAAIARQFGVAWRPAGNERVIIDRPGRPVPREAVIEAVRSALTDAGAPADADIDLPGLTFPLVSPEAAPQMAVEQLDYDAATGRFAAMLAITTTDQPLQRLRLAGQVQDMITLPVTTHRLPAGSVIGPGDLQMQRVRAVPWRETMLRDPAQAIGLAARRAIAAGQPVALSGLAPPIAVLKGARVAMDLRGPGLSLSAIGQAMEPGAIGARIAVLNPASRAVVMAEIVGPDRVRVIPDALPRDGVVR